MPPDHQLADVALHLPELVGAVDLHGLHQQAADEVELDRQPGGAVHGEPRHEAGVVEEGVRLVQVAVDEDVLPRDQCLVEHDDRVVLVHPARQGIVERAGGPGRGHLVRGTAEQLHPGDVHRRHEHHAETLLLDPEPVVGDEVEVGQRGPGGHHLRPAHHQARVGLPIHVHVHVGNLLRAQLAVHWRVHERVVDVQHALLALPVPAAGVVAERDVEVGLGAQGREERRLVVGRAAEPAVAAPLPGRDGVA